MRGAVVLCAVLAPVCGMLSSSYASNLVVGSHNAPLSEKQLEIESEQTAHINHTIGFFSSGTEFNFSVEVSRTLDC